MAKRIPVCLDGSLLSEQILPHVAEIATQSSAKVVLFKVLPETIGGVTGVSEKPSWSVLHRGKGQDLPKTPEMPEIGTKVPRRHGDLSGILVKVDRESR